MGKIKNILLKIGMVYTPIAIGTSIYSIVTNNSILCATIMFVNLLLTTILRVVND